MTYSNEVNNMCVVAKGPNHRPPPFLKRENGFRPRRLKTSLDIPMVSVGVLPSRALASSL